MLTPIPYSDLRGQQPKLPAPLISGAWVAGGAVRRWFTGESGEHDIDLFFRDADVRLEYLTLCGLRDRMPVSKDTNDTYILEDDTRLQFNNVYRPTPDKLVLAFDYYLCMFVWDGQKVLATSGAKSCALNKVLSLYGFQSGFEYSTLRRAFKYVQQGYTPDRNLITKLIAGILAADPLKQQSWFS